MNKTSNKSSIKDSGKNTEKNTAKYSKRMMVGGALGVIALSTTGVASAHLGNNPETREAIKSAFEAKSFSAFQEAAKDSPIIDTIDSEEKFNKLVQAHELKQSGDKEGAMAIKQELGLKRGHHGKGSKGKNPQVKAAIEAADYTAFKEAINDGHFAQKIDSAQKFGRLVEVNELRAQGEYEKARAIMDELGISHKERKGKSVGNDKQVETDKE